MDDIADALHALHPPFDPGDITTWPVEKLDELGVWHASAQGVELTDHPYEAPMLIDSDAAHGVNEAHEMNATVPPC